jgi:hypothetical protein
MRATWKPHEKHGRLTTQSDLPDSVYAFPKQRKEPLTDASHVRNAMARMDQVEGVSAEDRDLAFANIKKAAKHYDVELSEGSWQDVGVHPQRRTAGAARGRKKAAKKKTTRRKTTGKKVAAKKTSRASGAAKRRKTTRKKATRKR